jgi:hypothetical protein
MHTVSSSLWLHTPDGTAVLCRYGAKTYPDSQQMTGLPHYLTCREGRTGR